LPFALVAIHGLSAQVPPEIWIGAVNVAPWSVDFLNMMWLPCI
jgi:hypothetical protein